jgi:hypothetical protein
MESFEDIFSYWRKSSCSLVWDCPFVLPPWLKVWWNIFGSTSEIYLCAVRRAQDLIGLAPLRINGQRAAFIGSTDVCDYQDFIVAPGKGDAFFSVLLDHLRQQGIIRLDLKPLRPESIVLTELTALRCFLPSDGCYPGVGPAPYLGRLFADVNGEAAP